MKKNLTIKSLQLITLIPLYYIVGNKSIFNYVLSLSLYNIFLACFSHIDLNTISYNLNKEEKRKLLTNLLLYLSIICLFFTIISVISSDIISNILKLDDLFLIFIMMGLSTVCEPTVNIISNYLNLINKNKKSKLLIYSYHILDSSLLLILSLLLFRIINISNNIGLALLYLSKIISLIIVVILLLVKSKEKTPKIIKFHKLSYNKEIKKILTKNYYVSIINIVKKSYIYISIIILYLILSTRYNYAINDIKNSLSFLYFYGLTIILYLIDIVDNFINNNYKQNDLFCKMYNNYQILFPLSIILSIISPLLCKIIFNTSEVSIYLLMLSFLIIFISLFNISFENINNKKVIYISLISGLLLKIITIIPLIDAFYRIGNNLIYGDIISTIIGLITSIMINYIYLKNKFSTEEKYLEKILKSLYENIILCILLITIGLIFPINTESYLKSLGLIIVYLSISIMFFKIKNKKRG